MPSLVSLLAVSALAMASSCKPKPQIARPPSQIPQQASAETDPQRFIAIDYRLLFESKTIFLEFEPTDGLQLNLMSTKRQTRNTPDEPGKPDESLYKPIMAQREDEEQSTTYDSSTAQIEDPTFAPEELRSPPIPLETPERLILFHDGNNPDIPKETKVGRLNSPNLAAEIIELMHTYDVVEFVKFTPAPDHDFTYKRFAFFINYKSNSSLRIIDSDGLIKVVRNLTTEINQEEKQIKITINFEPKGSDDPNFEFFAKGVRKIVEANPELTSMIVVPKGQNFNPHLATYFEKAFADRFNASSEPRKSKPGSRISRNDSTSKTDPRSSQTSDSFTYIIEPDTESAKKPSAQKRGIYVQPKSSAAYRLRIEDQKEKDAYESGDLTRAVKIFNTKPTQAEKESIVVVADPENSARFYARINKNGTYKYHTITLRPNFRSYAFATKNRITYFARNLRWALRILQSQNREFPSDANAASFFNPNP